ncbi:hypothetical protein DICVIV_08891 [Dictyocaulus viviparus]|uniref:SAC3/GANP/THP3 conserved domain-containing protein n=1 Tax=Dictyocaulus viviparus TaxID=29172 RepID=A0A0D8XMP5_DICVI|nr:hypothetical protein DICVIV_08891 [Dictyocaulus viviparus]
MCPEKERYVRIVQKRISQFECASDGSLQPHLMVKEYARSAADQDNPLPHELRSKALLENTMDYLLINKILYSHRCARLHILCAYKLCQLGFDKFDQNMNTENLAKCLQSLRHLYEDLRLQGNVFNTESEFRGYDVMLHLYDSNIFRQVKECVTVGLGVHCGSCIVLDLK